MMSTLRRKKRRRGKKEGKKKVVLLVDPRRRRVAAGRAFVLGLVQNGGAFGLVVCDIHGQRLVELGLRTCGRQQAAGASR